ncbi:MAG: 2-oxo acid dehydrogenase subunit E2 [Caldilineales bacterium]
MPVAVIMPKFEMTQETGTVGSWLKGEGEAVRQGESILEIETDKVSMEVEAPADGTLVGISAEPGQVVPVGQTIAYVLRAGETWTAPTDGSKQTTAQASTPVAEQAPVQAPARPTQSPAQNSAEPASRPAVAASPLAARVAADLGVDLSAVTGTGLHGQVTRKDVEAHLRTETTGTANKTAKIDTVADGLSAPAAASNSQLRAVPAARRLGRELGVDLAQVHGSGPQGRIQSVDVRAFAAKQAEAAARLDLQAPSADLAAASTPANANASALPAGSPAIRRMIPLTSMRRTIVERMTTSVREAPQFTVSLDVDMTRARSIVDDLKAGAADQQPRVTLTVLLIRACAWALARHPEANSAFVDGQIAEWDTVNVGVATAVEAGLIVPVVHDADRLGMRAIAAQLADLAVRAREGRLKLDDLQGGTFTLSNLGMFGIDRFTAILNPPQAAILAVGRMAKRPVVTQDDMVEIRPLSTMTLTADHRVLDGASAARFLATIQQALEHPGMLLE